MLRRSCWQVNFFRECDSDGGCDYRLMQGAMKTELSCMGSGVERKRKIGCMDNDIPPPCTLELSFSPSAAGVRIPAREGAIRIGNGI